MECSRNCWMINQENLSKNCWNKNLCPKKNLIKTQKMLQKLLISAPKVPGGAKWCLSLFLVLQLLFLLCTEFIFVAWRPNGHPNQNSKNHLLNTKGMNPTRNTIGQGLKPTFTAISPSSSWDGRISCDQKTWRDQYGSSRCDRACLCPIACPTWGAAQLISHGKKLRRHSWCPNYRVITRKNWVMTSQNWMMTSKKTGFYPVRKSDCHKIRFFPQWIPAIKSPTDQRL